MRLGAVLLLLFLTACGAATPAPTTLPPRATVPAVTAPVAIATATTAPAAVAVASAIPATSAAAAPATASSTGEYTDAKGNRLLGSPNAPVTLTDYSDFL